MKEQELGNSFSQPEDQTTKPFYKKWWVWVILIVLILGVGVIFVLAEPKNKKDKKNGQPSQGTQNDVSAKECVENALGKEKAKSIKDGLEVVTAEEQKIIENCNKGQSDSVYQANESVQKPTEKITIILPFDTRHLPKNINPMGETVEHPDPPNPGGHPGIDYIFNNEKGEEIVPILAMADGEVKRAEDEGPGKGSIVCINSGSYAYCFGHLKTIDPSIKTGAPVKQGQKVGTGSNIHNDFGYARNSGDWVPERLCPLTFLSYSQRIILENIPISDKMIAAGFTEVCNGEYKEKNE